MAITLYDQPQLIAPAGNPLVFTFSSDETAQPNFSFIVEVYINGNLRLTQEVYRQFNTLGRIDVSEAVQSTLSSPLIVDGTLLTFYDSAINDYYIIVYEKYGSPVPQLYDDETSSTLYGINAALRHQDFIAWDYLDHAVSTSNPNSGSGVTWLTDWPRDRKYFLGNDERLFMGILNGDPGYFQVRYRLYDANNTIIVQHTESFAANQFPVADVSPQTIIANTAITQTDFDDCVYYELTPRGAQTGGSYSGGGETFRIYMDRECKRYETRRLHWLNKYGVWDSFTFSLVSTDSSTVQSYGYQREKGVWDDTSYIYPLYQGEKVDFAKTSADQLILNSDWIYESVQQWLVRSLMESPSVYLEVEDGTEFEPVKVTNTSYQLKTRRRDGLIQEQITLERTYTYRSQLN
jgi:hypothetical protein